MVQSHESTEKRLKHQLDETKKERDNYEKELYMTKRELLEADQEILKWRDSYCGRKCPTASRGREQQLKQSIAALEKKVADYQKELKEANDRTQIQVNDANERAMRAQSQVDDANERADRAVEALQRLHTLLESAVVKRGDYNSTSFPTGHQITANLKSSQERAEEFFFDLVDLLEKHKGGKKYSAIVREVLSPAAIIAREQHQSFVSRKARQLEELVEDRDQHENRLHKLFVSSTMQRLVHKHLNEDRPYEFDEATLEEHPKLLTWATSDAVVRNEEMYGKTVGSFVQEMTHLYHQCRYSEPPCHLYPTVGDIVPFSSDHHVQRTTRTLSTKAKTGDSVRVLYPGLYYQDPEAVDSRARPIQKALVLLICHPSEQNKSDPPEPTESGLCCDVSCGMRRSLSI